MIKSRLLDLVLNVADIEKWAPNIGKEITIKAIPKAKHDVILSIPPVREYVFEELGKRLGQLPDGN